MRAGLLNEHHHRPRLAVLLLDQRDQRAIGGERRLRARAAADAFPSRQLTSDQARRLAHGGRLPGGSGGLGPEAAFAPDGTLIALVEEKDGQTRPVVVFAPAAN